MDQIALFIDTCIYLSCKPLTDIDWPQVSGSKETMIIVPVVVAKELDEKKTCDPNNIVRERAHRVIKKLAEFSSLETPAEIRPGVTLDFDRSNPPMSSYQESELDATWRDDRLIAAVLHYAKRHSDTKVAIVTDDFGLKLRASNYSIEVVSVPEEPAYRLPEPLDPGEKELRKAKEKIAAFECQVPDLMIRFKGDQNYVELEAKPPLAQCPDELDMIMRHFRDQYPKFQLERPRTARGANPIAQLSQQIQYMMDHISSLNRPPVDKMKEYNSQLDEFFDSFEKHLRDDFSEENIKRRTFLLDLVLTNKGRVPAEEVYIDIHLRNLHEVRLCDEFPEYQEAPEAPSRPRLSILNAWTPPTKIMLGGGLCPAGMKFPVPDLNSNVRGPNTGSDGLSASYYVQKLIHNFTEPLSSIYVAFDNYAALSGFPIECEIRAGNLPEPVTYTLNVKIAKSA